MKKFFGYIRVSTVKQGERGVSLQEQRDAIERYAQRNDIQISQWFEERETAAKRGRQVFGLMMKLIRRGKACGLVIHKIDRGARNLRDWADLGDLIDSGIEVRFANESVDLNSRGGRLSADIQAVVAADFIRNLREETKKGFYGRLKQGLYPLPAPIGYSDVGRGKAKEPDPARAPLVREAFELYASGQYSLDRLVEELHRRGLRNRNGGQVARNGFSVMLNNPFYIGIIRLSRTQETFLGVHQPLIPKSLFDRVQTILKNKTNARTRRHYFLFRRLFSCKRCRNSLVGEEQKGHVYYRCHTPHCSLTCIREDALESEVESVLTPLQFSEKESAYLSKRASALSNNWAIDRENALTASNLQLKALEDRLGRLTDAFIDGVIEKDLFERRKEKVIMERKNLEERLAALKTPTNSVPDQWNKFLELIQSAYLLYKEGEPEEKQELLEIVTSNRIAEGKKAEVTLAPPFQEVANRAQNLNGSPSRDRIRTLEKLVCYLWNWFVEHPTARFSLEPGKEFLQNNRSEDDGKTWKFAA